MLFVAEPTLGEEEKRALSEVIDQGWITMGERVSRFEREFAEKHEMQDAVAVSSCTAGLHLVMLALGIQPGDEVLVPAMTFAASVNCVLYVGARPVFVDIESLDMPLMSIDDATAKCTEKTKAIILVHYAGYLADRSRWRTFAAERGIVLIEDAAHAAGMVGAGTIGTAGVFSFYGNKNLTTAEGGMVVSEDYHLLERIRQLRAHGLTASTFQRHLNQGITYDVTMLGYNYRMDELRAALGLVQLKNLDTWNKKRRDLSLLYHKILPRDCPEIRIPFYGHPGGSAHHIMPVVLPSDSNRQQVMSKLYGMGIQTTVHYPPAHKLSLYRDLLGPTRLPWTEKFASHELTLPLHPRMTEAQVEQVSEALAEALAQISQQELADG
ncbi:DegT/DnrJ/EryC1/StrS aminotransferase family protein [Microvirga sp. VF16]|uniref:DegT/DnrJ/EryC1/StrS family aminotransferase n=1 Tax=Microvirga sp. VF16 TaxID=2807101 RepID=UPI00193D79BE|nr:DegT/DnrJ/EryC1/StrS aminotransferase family protein [Microvirga sp. VF16]QRM27252.1 DegT/DnrJ/EryC1/StrS aminotransferase family protein [Microvirga sp. VF16]